MNAKNNSTETAAAAPEAVEMAKSAEQVKEGWLAIRKSAGRKIDPETAEVVWCYQYTLDPYGIGLEIPEEYRQSGREYFARAPGSDIWVWFGDLPRTTGDALWEKHKTKLAFPAGLPPIDDSGISAEFKDGRLVFHISEAIREQAAKGAAQMAKLAEQIANGCNSGDSRQFATETGAAEMVMSKRISIFIDAPFRL